jgi:hypothetical protein
MATKIRTDSYEPIKGTVICRGHLDCRSKMGCPHHKLHKWIKNEEGRPSHQECFNQILGPSHCDCIPMTKVGLLLESY